MEYSPDHVFYGWTAEPGREKREPLLASLVKSSKIRKEALDLLAAGGQPGEYGLEVYGCPHCKCLYERFFFSITTGEKTFEPEYKCSKCKRTLRNLRLDFDEWYMLETILWPCPLCGNKALSFCWRGSWD